VDRFDHPLTAVGSSYPRKDHEFRAEGVYWSAIELSGRGGSRADPRNVAMHDDPSRSRDARDRLGVGDVRSQVLGAVFRSRLATTRFKDSNIRGEQPHDRRGVAGRQRLLKRSAYGDDFDRIARRVTLGKRTFVGLLRRERTHAFHLGVILQFGGGTVGHPWGSAAGATANRVALEAVVQARNEGRNLLSEGTDILKSAARHSGELRAAMETWKGITFDYESVDALEKPAA